MDKELKLLIEHSNVLNELYDSDELEESGIIDEFKDISLYDIFQGKEKFVPFSKLIHTINLFFKYEVDYYPLLLDFLVKNYVLKLQHNAITSKEAIYPVMMDIKKKLLSEGLSNYLFTSNSIDLEPSDIFRSAELLSALVKYFRREVFTSSIIAKGLSFLSTREDIEEMFGHITSHSFCVTYEDLIKESIDVDNDVLLDYLITKHDQRKDIKNLKVDYSNCANYSATKGSLNCLRYIHKNGGSWDEYVCAYAAENGHLGCLKYARENGGFWNEQTCHSAARGGNLNCLKYAHEHGCPWNEQTCHYAADANSLDCLKYIYENGGSWNENTCAYAAENGHLDCLKYLHENGCLWNERTCILSVENGHLNCLKYVYENGGSGIWGERTCSSAARKGHLDCLKYAHENGCPWDEDTCSGAEGSNNLDCLRYAINHGCPY